MMNPDPMDPPKDVMLLLHDLGSGGTSRVTQLLANGFAARGIATTLVVCRNEGVLAPLLDPRVRLIALDGRRTGRNAGMLFNRLALARLLRSERPSLVMSSANHMHVLAVLAWRLARLPASRLVIKMTNPVVRGSRWSPRNLVRSAFYRWAFRQADRILLITESARGDIHRIAPGADDRLVVVNNPYISEAMLEAACDRSSVRRGHLLAVGRLVPQKGYDLLLAALGRLRKMDWRLDVLGDGPLLESLERQARQLGIADRVDFRGFVADPLPYFRQTQALVLSSRWEGQGAVLLEALACGCPVIAMQATEAVAEALGGGRFGRLTPRGDIAALARAIASELALPSRAPREARSWVERYGIDAGIDSHVEALGLSCDRGKAQAPGSSRPAGAETL
jgi:glycosyltransferase involved in cell wall biosynthesis